MPADRTISLGIMSNSSLSIDVIVPVYNGLDHVRECIKSLLAHRDENVRLVVVDDGSFPHVNAWLRKNLSGQRDIQLVTLKENGGYLRAANVGIDHVKADIVIFQNSDTIIFEGFFDRVRAIFLGDPTIGIVNPVSVWANWTRIPFPSGQTIHSLAELLWSSNGLATIDIYNASGFCFAISGSLLADIGPFDVAYEAGYWEETDLCMKALEKGCRVVCAPGIFVFHHGWGSFGAEQRDVHMTRNEEVFRKRWQAVYGPLEEWFRSSDPLSPIIETLESKAYDFQVARGDRHLKVLYILPAVSLYGGVISVVQLVNQLVLQGVDANIAVIGKFDPSVLRYAACYFQPLVFAGEEDFLVRCPLVDVVMATHWTTAYTAVKVVSIGRARKAGYFVQDYEPDFHETDPIKARMAEFTYTLIQYRICKTAWLKRKLAKFGGATEIVPLGLNVDVFFDQQRERRRLLVTMARPSSPRRNWPAARKVLELLAEGRPDIQLGVFGYTGGDLPSGTTNFGLLPTAISVANVMNQAQVFLDASIFQGFGRPGLEAIACGTVPVLTHKGGITSYAKHMHNCILIYPDDPAGIAQTIIDLFDDAELLQRLRTNGRGLPANYALQQEGSRTREFIERLSAS